MAARAGPRRSMNAGALVIALIIIACASRWPATRHLRARSDAGACPHDLGETTDPFRFVIALQLPPRPPTTAKHFPLRPLSR